MIVVIFLMPGNEPPNFTADLSVGTWAGVATTPAASAIGGRSHLNLEVFEPSRLALLDTLDNPIRFQADENPGPVFLEITVANQGAGVLHVEPAGASTLILQPGERATVSYHRNAPMSVRKP